MFLYLYPNGNRLQVRYNVRELEVLRHDIRVAKKPAYPENGVIETFQLRRNNLFDYVRC